MWLLEELKLPYKLKTYKRTKDRLADPVSTHDLRCLACGVARERCDPHGLPD